MLWIRILLFSLCAVMAGPEPVSGIDAMSAVGQALNGSSDEKKPLEVPSPWNLSPTWWDYFKVEGEEYDQRVSNFENELRRTLAAADRETIEKLEPLLSRIQLNLRALPQARQQGSEAVTPLRPYAETYTTEQFLEVLRLLSVGKTELDQFRQDLETQTAALSESTKRYDTLLGAYLQSDDGALNRLILGFELAAQQASIAVAEQKIRLSRLRVAAQEKVVGHAEGEILAAEERLAFDATSLSQLRGKLRSAERMLETAETDLLNAEARSLEFFPNTARGRAISAQLNQQVVQSRVQLAFATASLVRLQMLEGLNRWLSLDQRGSTREWLRELREWKAAESDLTEQMESLEVSSRREYSRASEAKLALDGSTDATSRALVEVHDSRLRTAQVTLDDLQRLSAMVSELGILRRAFEERILDETSQFGQLVYRFSEVLLFLFQGLMSILQTSLFKIGGVPVTLFGILRAIFIVVVSLWFSSLARMALKRVAQGQRRLEASTFYTLGRLAHYSLLSLGLIVGLVSLGIDFSNLALVAGALSVGIGFGLQSIVGNFVSGLILLFEGSLKVGDFLELESGMRGRITAINVRSTVIRTNDGIEILVPNAEIAGNRVINWTMSDVFRRVHVPFGVAYGSDKERVNEVVLEAAAKVDHTLKGHPGYREPRVFMTGFGDSALEFELVVWVNRQAAKRHRATLSSYYWAIHDALIDAGITIPFPQRDIHVIEDIGLKR